MKFVIRGTYCGDRTFPSLNQYLQETGRNPKDGGAYKKKFMRIASNAIRRDLKAYRVKGAVILHYKFYEPRKGQKRDLMNIFSFADKVIEDALQECKVLPNDNPEYVRNCTHEFYYTDSTPYIEVEIEEVETPVL